MDQEETANVSDDTAPRRHSPVTPDDSPVSLHPLTFEEALEALLSTPADDAEEVDDGSELDA